MKTYTYGIISTASIVPRFIQGIQASKQGNVYAIASRSLDKAQNMAATYHIEKAYGSYEALYEDENIDIVYIATPNDTHYEQAYNALSHHKHVIVEKPISLTMEDTLALFQYAQEQGCFLMEAQKSVFLPATIRLKEIIDKKELGELRQVQMLSSFTNTPANHWMYKEYGGVLYGSASYTIEYMMYLLDNPTLQAQGMGLIHDQGAIEDVSLNLNADEEILINSHITMKVATNNQATFYFEHGRVVIDEYWKARHLRIVQDDETKTEQFPCDFEMVYEIDHVHKCLDDSLLQSPIMSAERSVLCCYMVEQLLDEIYGAMEEDEE